VLDYLPTAYILNKTSFQIVAGGLSLAQEGRKVFAPVTVLKNMQIGAFSRAERQRQ
jgi:branched-chain amino acid transport system ATP-binding protein